MPTDRTTWQTPRWILDELVDAFGTIYLDPATAPDNPTGALRFFTKEDDGLMRSWLPIPEDCLNGDEDLLCFVNPPYRRGLNRVWADAIERNGRLVSQTGQNSTLAALMPVSTSTYWWRAMSPDATYFLPKRVGHVDPETGNQVRGTSFDSAILVWRKICRCGAGVPRYLFDVPAMVRL